MVSYSVARVMAWSTDPGCAKLTCLLISPSLRPRRNWSMTMSSLASWAILGKALIASSSSNFISRRIQYYTFHTHNSLTISQMYSFGGCQRSSVAHRADNRYFNNDTAVGKQGARGNIYFLFSQMCRAHYIRNMSGSIRVSLTFAYSLMIRHGAHKYKIITTAKHACTRDIIKFNKFIYMFQWNVLW